MRAKKRPLTLIEWLVITAVAAVIGRVAYHVVHWKDVVNDAKAATPLEIAVALALGLVYVFWTKRLKY